MLLAENLLPNIKIRSFDWHKFCCIKWEKFGLKKAQIVKRKDVNEFGEFLTTTVVVNFLKM